MTESAARVLAVRDVGETGLLVEVDPPATVGRLVRWVRDQQRATGLSEVVPAARTVLLAGDPETLRWFASAVVEAELPDVVALPGRTVELPVVYDGADLPDVAVRTGLDVAEVITRHRDAEHLVAFFGFSPGQAFLVGVPTELRVPRRRSPRTRVPSDSLAIANEHSTVYPQASPGGWNLIGRYVGPPLWDTGDQPPNVLAVGDRVVFREVR